MNYMINAGDRKELIDAAVINYREGGYGPLSFKMRLRQIGGMDRDEIDAMTRQHFDECARNMRTGNKL